MRRFSYKLWVAILAISFSLGFSEFSVPLQAQGSSGSIVGVVTDSSGAVLPGATVTVTDLATNDKRTARTSATGEYRFVDLDPANYKIEVSAKTFKQFVVESAAVQVGGTLRFDATMQVGGATETVEVDSQPALLQTETSAVGYEVEGKQVNEMPLNGRNVQNLIALVPGVVPQGASEGSAGENEQSHTSNLGWGNYQIGGGMSGQGGEYIDDAPINGLGGNTTTLVITQDAVQEFRVETNAVSPEYGRFSGGVVAMVTKGGANAFHGSVYEYFRNKDLNANNFFNNYSGLPRSIWNQDQYGTVVSGPIKKDKAFFSFVWEGFKDLLGVPNPTNVPTANMQAGIFTRPITDPTGRCAIVQNIAAGTWTVPQSCWDATAKVMKALWPLPLTPNNPADNYYVDPTTGTHAEEWNGRIDYNISAKQRFFGRYTYWELQDISPQEFRGSYPAGNTFNSAQTGNAFSQTASHQAVLGDTYTINPNTIADLRVSYNRAFYNQVPPSLGINEGVFGPAYAAMSPSETAHEIASPGLSGLDGLYGFPAMDFDSVDRWNTYSLVGDVIRIIGRHTFKFGGEERLMEHSGFGNISNASGRFTISNQTTDVGGNTATGDEFASFLLGEMQNATITTAERTDTYNYSTGLYVLDNWQVNHHLTLNLGLRWELPGGMEENHDRATVLLPHTLDPSTGYTGTLALVNSSLYPSRSLEPIHHDLFSPRVGFAQTLAKNTVVRGGFGLVYLSPDLPSGLMAFNSTVNNAGTTTLNPNNQMATNSAFLSNPFPTGFLQPVGRTNQAFMTTRLGQSLSGPIPTTHYPYMGQWNLTVAQEFWGKLMAQAAYVGSKGTHIPLAATPSIDELSSQYYGQGSALLVNTLCAADGGASISLGNCDRPYPEYKNLSNNADFSGSSTYHSLQAQAQMRFKSAGLLTGNYTWAKFISDTDTLNGGAEQAITSGTVGGYQDYNNKRGERSLASFDVRQRALINYLLNLPFGKGQRYASDVSGVEDKVISGWAVNGITTFQAGFPLELTYNGGNVLSQQFGAGTIRPNYVAGCQKATSGSRNQRALTTGWINAACFTNPGSYAFGNEPRTDPTLRGQGIDNFDFSVLKATTIKEATNVQFRMEFFNLFNHTQFGQPATAVGGKNFGISTVTVNQPRLVQASLRVNF